MSFGKNLIGGVVIMVVAGLIGLAHNAVRGNPVKLIPKMAGSSSKSAAAEKKSNTPVQTPQSTPAAEEAPMITDGEFATGELPKERVRTIMKAGTATIIDARGEDEFAEGHIPGAMNVPYEKLMEYTDQLELVPIDSPVICYCRSVTCDLSDDLARELRLMGYEKVVLYRGGWDEWSEAGFPAEGEGMETE